MMQVLLLAKRYIWYEAKYSKEIKFVALSIYWLEI